jgi:potassium/chloride transporter 9
MERFGPRKRDHSNFQSRSARDDAGELSRRQTISEDDVPSRPSASREQSNPYEPATNDSAPPPREYGLTKRLLHIHQGDGEDSLRTRRRSTSGKRQTGLAGEDSSHYLQNGVENKKANGNPVPKPGLGPRPVGGSEKLGLFSGVYVPTCLNVLSILMFLRFGFILGV